MSEESVMRSVSNGIGYSEAVKREVVELVVSGKLSQGEARRKYGIGGHTTIKKWVHKYQGIKMSKGKKRLVTASRVDESAKLKEEKKQLEEALLKATVRLHCLENIIEHVEARYGADFKKAYTPR